MGKDSIPGQWASDAQSDSLRTPIREREIEEADMKKGIADIGMRPIRSSWERVASQTSNDVWNFSWPGLFDQVWTEVHWNVRKTIEDQIKINLKELI